MAAKHPQAAQSRRKGAAAAPSPARAPSPNGALDRVFGLSRAGTSVATELRAGLATFLTMAYIMFVNPAILEKAGMDHGAVFVATCLAAAAGSAIMGLYANYPIALAPGMGLNAYFAFTVVPELGGNWQLALALVFVSCLLFFALSLSPLRAWLIDAIPMPLKLGIAAGIGLFLALIGLQNAGIVAEHPVTLVTLGDLSKPQAAARRRRASSSSPALAVRKVPGAIIVGVLAVTLIAAASRAGAVARHRRTAAVTRPDLPQARPRRRDQARPHHHRAHALAGDDPRHGGDSDRGRAPGRVS